ncbi:Cation efflux family, putative [Leishmania donovani]|uniref:Cation efflux family, putative n=1 Tax=Leishmania donovani TaxID=5661 RepID=A0A3S7X5K5_LEIDO|nr:Cation efflux family, putative [Leishmania donovani]
MLQEVCTLLFTPSRDKGVRRWQQAAITFSGLWGISIFFMISTSFLIASMQALVLLNTAASLTAAAVTQSLCSRAGTQQSYPFGFGLYRLSVVVRLGSTIFLVFGCVTTMVESLHRGTHGHHSNPSFLLALGGLQLLSQLVFLRDVCLTDRVTGHRGMAGAHSEDLLHLLCVSACRDRRGMGGGGFFEEFHSPSSALAQSQPPGGSPAVHGPSCGAQRTMRRNFTQTAVYLLCPITCVVASLLMVVTDSSLPDVVGALWLAVYYAYVGYRNGRDMLDLLMNKCVTDPRRLRNLEQCLRNIKMLDGVLQVQSTVWWNLNVSESMLLIRLRLMSGSDACSVSHAVRRQLAELATYVYVECFPANGANDLGHSTQLSWGASLMGAHGHSHGVHGHNHGGVQGHEHGHSHSNGRDDDNGHHDHGCDHSHSHLFASKGEVNLPARIYSNEFGNINGDPPTDSVGADLPYGEQGFPGAVSSTAYAGGAPAALAFPTPPAATSGGCDSSTKRHGLASGVPPIGRPSSVQALPMAYDAANRSATLSTPSPFTGVPHGASSSCGGGCTNEGSRFAQHAPGDTAAQAADSLRLPAAPSSRLPAIPPPAFTPFRDGDVHIGSNVRGGAPHSATYDHV